MPVIEYLKQLPVPARVVLATVVAVALAILLWVLSIVIGETASHLQSLEQTKPRIGRLLGYIDREQALRRARNQTRKQLDALAYSEEADANQVGAQLQQALRAYAEDSGLKVSGSQLLKRTDKDAYEGFELMFVELSMVGEPDAIDSFLALVDAHEPILRVDGLVVAQQRQTRRSSRRAKDNDTEEEDVIMQVTVSALRVAKS